MSFLIAPEAVRDLDQIYDFIARDNPGAADRLLDRLFTVFQRLADGELHGPEVRRLDGRRVHGWSVPPYRVYYRRTATRTFIVRFYHLARRPIE